MKTLSEKIKSIYPQLTDADFRNLVLLQNDSDGLGDYISAWLHPSLSQPTETQLLLAESLPISSAQIVKDLERAVDQHIESVAHADRWDSRVTCTMRAGYPNPWQNKAIAFGQWMDTCYAHCIQVQADVAAGTRPIPTSAELIAELPVMVWPV
jgi:hypothetical protein